LFLTLFEEHCDAESFGAACSMRVAARPVAGAACPIRRRPLAIFARWQPSVPPIQHAAPPPRVLVQHAGATRSAPPPNRLKDQLGDQIGGSEWEPIKILLQRENSAYTPNSQPRIATRVCQSHVVIKDVPTLGTKLQTIPKRKHDSRSKGLSCPAGYLADRPQPPGGPSARTRWTVRELRRMSEK
jgi:hypothetical protein